jgi:hypothetical protein
MAWKKDWSATFTGSSGQMAVIGELLHRKCNAAIPLIDVGTDVFALRDDREEVARIQVKTAQGQRYRKQKGYYARFSIPKEQLGRADSPPLYYALAVRLDDAWGSYLVISRAKFVELWNAGLGSGSEGSPNLQMHVQFRENGQASRAICGQFDLSEFINAWNDLPPLRPLVPIGA